MGKYASVMCSYWARSRLPCWRCGSAAADIDFGKPGEPVKLVVGYQPYYTQSWSGVIMRGKKFYEKYLPKGSTVDFQIGLQGAIIVNNMLAGKQHIGYMGDMPSHRLDHQAGGRRYPPRRHARHRLGPVQHFPGAHRRAEIRRTTGSDQMAGRQDGGGAEGQLHRPLRAGGVQARRHTSRGLSEPEHRGDHQQLPRGQARRRGDVGADRRRELVQEGLARSVATGVSVQRKRRRVPRACAPISSSSGPTSSRPGCNAELDAQLFIADPKNAQEIIKMAKRADHRLLGKSAVDTRSTARIPRNGAAPDAHHPAITPSRRRRCELINRASAFLFSIKSINAPQAAARSGHAGICGGGVEGARPEGADRTGNRIAGLGFQAAQLAVSHGEPAAGPALFRRFAGHRPLLFSNRECLVPRLDEPAD